MSPIVYVITKRMFITPYEIILPDVRFAAELDGNGTVKISFKNYNIYCVKGAGVEITK